MIDWTNFTPASALAGGVLIGLAAALLLFLNGRIAGISGIIGNLLQYPPAKSDVAWRLAFTAGLIVSPLLFVLFHPLPTIQVDASSTLLVVAGLLVGIGTRYGSGCTSGHGVCGLSRFSVRSLVATISFMLAGFVTVFVMRHLLAA